VLRLSTERVKEGEQHAEKRGKQGNVGGEGDGVLRRARRDTSAGVRAGLGGPCRRGVGAPFNLGQTTTVDRMSSLVGSHAGAMLRVENDGTGTALDLRVGPTNATPANNTVTPMRVNSQKKVTNLNTDELDGMDWTELAPRGYAQVTTSDPFVAPGSAKGVIDIDRTSPGNVYCFNLTFEPKAAVASANINNNATVGTVVGSAVDSKCGTSFEAAAVTYAANTDPSPARNDINFGIVFM
jgi:hypothetical protein